MNKNNQLNRLAIPSILSGLAEPIISLADQYFVGQLDSINIGAVGLGAAVCSTLVWVLGSIKNPGASKIAQLLGKDQSNKINEIIPSLLGFTVLISITLIGFAYTFSDQIFSWFGANDTLHDRADAYFAIRCIGLPFLIMAFVIFGIIKGFQNTMYAMKATLIGGALNILLDALFTSPSIGLNLGVAGIAWASVISQFVIFGFALSALSKFARVRISFTHFAPLQSVLKNAGQILIRIIILNTALLLSNRYATSVSDDTLTVHSLLINIWLFSAFFIDGYANAGLALVAKHHGAQDKANVIRTVRSVFINNLIFGLLLAITIGISLPFIGNQFDLNLEAMESLGSAKLFASITIFLGAMAFSLDGLMMGFGHFKILTVALAAATFPVLIPLLEFNTDELNGIWIAMSAWIFVRSLIPGLKLLSVLRAYPV